MKKWCLIAVLILSLVLLSGCVEVEYHLKINKDASADLQYKFGMNNGLLGLVSSEGENPIEEMRHEAESQGYKVTNYSNEQITGIIASKHFKTLKEVPGFEDLLRKSDSQANIKGETPLVIEKGFFKDRYHLDGHIDLTDMKGNSEDDLEGLGNAMLSQVKMRFILTLPYKPTNHNASLVRDDGRTLEWQLIPGQDNKLQMDVVVPNVRNIALCVVGAVLLLAGVSVAIIISRNKKKPSAVGGDMVSPGL